MRVKNLSMSLFTWAFFVAKAVETPLVLLNFDGNEQTLEAGEAHSSARVSGVRGEAAWFWGEQEQGITATGTVGIAPTEEITVAAWIWLQRLGDHQTILWKGDRSRAIQQVNFRLAVRPEGTLEFSFKGPADEWYDFASPAPVPLHRWVHVAASFNRGKAALEIGGVRVREGRMHMYTGKGKPPAWAGDAMPTNTAPLEIGAGQGPSGEPGQFFCGALDEVTVWPTARALPIPDPAVPDARSPLESMLLFERSFSAEELRAKPWLCGRVGDGRVPWVLSVRFPDSKRQEILAHGTNDPDGTFRRLFDDYCGPFDLRGASNVNVRIYRNGGAAGQAVPTEASLQPDADSAAHIEVETEKPLQQIRGFGCYADFPKSFRSDPEAREREYAPFLDALKEIGVTRLDFSLQLQRFEPRNDDGDPRHINWEIFRKTFASEKEYRMVIGYLAYVQSKGFSVGLRVMGYPDWQWIGQGHGRHPDSDEVAEMCVAWVTLLREEGVFPTHLVPLWEPPYSPENVADICAKTARLMRQNKIDVQVVGPYRYATGGEHGHGCHDRPVSGGQALCRGLPAGNGRPRHGDRRGGLLVGLGDGGAQSEAVMARGDRTADSGGNRPRAVDAGIRAELRTRAVDFLSVALARFLCGVRVSLPARPDASPAIQRRRQQLLLLESV